MKEVMSLLDESDNRMSCLAMYPNDNNNFDDQYLISSSLIDGHVAVPEGSMEDYMWGGLWNLDNLHASLDALCANSNVGSWENMVIPFCGSEI